MRRLAVLLAALALAACGEPARSEPRQIRVAATPVPLDAANPSVQRAGAFAYAGGLWLRSPDEPGFGGLSDLKVDARGALVSESDEGGLLRAHILLDRGGRLAGLTGATFELLRGRDGRPLHSKHEADAEGVAVWPNSDLVVSFEHDHRIWRYPANGGPPQDMPMPDIDMPPNQGMEGLALAVSQGPGAYWVGVEGGSIWLCRDSRGCQQWSGLMAPPLGFRLTALGETPGGELVILHHNYNPLTQQTRVLASIVTIPRAPQGPSRLTAQLQLASPLTVDNLEGVAAVAAPNGGLRLYLISDDNFSDRQRTLLLAFDLSGPGAAKSSARPPAPH